jgi:hypothetical protein
MKRFLTMMLVLGLLLGCCAQAASYTTRLAADTEIYQGPGYACGYASDVGTDGVYTIVEEAVCEDGYLWGKLKSGVGWVMLRRAVYATDYTVQLGGWVQVYDGPGYDYGYVRTIGEDGVYTIVQEALDSEGNTWGRLKSGIGWVNLTDVRTTGKPVITVDLANRELLNNGGYLLYESEDPDYATTLVFYAHEMLRDVTLYGLLFDGEEYLTDPLYHFELFYEDTPLVAELPFYGDMTSYGISFTDAAGNERCYEVYISGRDGKPVIQEYVP